MNKKMIIYILAKMVGVEGLVLLLPAIVSLIYREKSGFCFLIVSAVLILMYFLLGRKVPKNKKPKVLPYRIHDLPDPDKLDNLNQFIARFGYKIRTGGSKAYKRKHSKLSRCIF